jgi:hypothetical protein
MAYALAEEIAANRPAKPGPEWWLLLDLALDADDLTRKTMCGYEYMAARTQAPRRTIFRWLQKLNEDDLIRTVEHSAGSAGGRKGKRAVYEIQVPPRLTARIAGQLSQVPPAVAPDSATTSGSQVPRGGTRLDQWEMPSQVPPAVAPDRAENGSQVPPAVAPPLLVPVGATPLEGAGQRSGQDRIDEDKITPLRRVRTRSVQTPGRRGQDLQPDSSVRVRSGLSSPAQAGADLRARESARNSDEAVQDLEPAPDELSADWAEWPA